MATVKPIRYPPELEHVGAQPFSAAGTELLLVAGGGQGAGASGAPSVVYPIHAAVKFPDATTCTLVATLWADKAGPPAWATGGTWVTTTPPSIVQNPNAALAGSNVAYVCTTGGAGAVAGAGPQGFGSGLSDGAGSPVLWRSALARLLVLTQASVSVPAVLVATLTNSLTLAGALASPGGVVAGITVTADLTPYLIGTPEDPVGELLLLMAVTGDPSDTVHDYTLGATSRISLFFS